MSNLFIILLEFAHLVTGSTGNLFKVYEWSSYLYSLFYILKLWNEIKHNFNFYITKHLALLWLKQCVMKGAVVSTKEEEKVLNENKTLIKPFTSNGTQMKKSYFQTSTASTSAPWLSANILQWKKQLIMPCYIVSTIFMGKF